MAKREDWVTISEWGNNKESIDVTTRYFSVGNVFATVFFEYNNKFYEYVRPSMAEKKLEKLGFHWVRGVKSFHI